MAKTPDFKYAPMFQTGKDDTEYYLLTKDYVSVSEFEGTPVLKVAPEGLRLMARTAFHDVSFFLRRSHNEQVAKILRDPEASDNDKYVALTFLRNAEVSSKGLMARRDSRCGPATAMRSTSPMACMTPTPSATSDIRRMHRSPCTRR